MPAWRRIRPPKPGAAKPAPRTPRLRPTAAGDLNLVGPPRAEPPAGALAEGFQHERRVIAQVIQAEVQNAAEQSPIDDEHRTRRWRCSNLRLDAGEGPAECRSWTPTCETSLSIACSRRCARRRCARTRSSNSGSNGWKAGPIASERLLAAKRTGTEPDDGEGIVRAVQLADGRKELRCRGGGREEAEKKMPGNPDHDRGAHWKRRMVGNYENFMQLRLERQKGVVDTLYQVEKSHIPFPDDQPIVYPGRRVVAADDRSPQGQVQFDGSCEEGERRKEDRRRSEVADGSGVRRGSAAQR